MHHQLSSATHTIELSQLAEINSRLPEQRRFPTAGDLGIGAEMQERHATGDQVSESAILIGLIWEGPPQFPYIRGLFHVEAHHDPRPVDLHTESLRRLSLLLGLRHTWG